jgi:hypothetical protein
MDDLYDDLRNVLSFIYLRSRAILLVSLIVVCRPVYFW